MTATPAEAPPAGEPAATEVTPPATGEAQLGDPGKRALTEERQARKAEKDRADALQAELDKIRQASETGDQKARREAEQAIARAREEAGAEARAAVTRERVIDKIEVAAAGKFADVEDAQLHLGKRADEFIKDGVIDTAAIGKAVDKLLEDKPHLAANPKTTIPAPGRVGVGVGSSSADAAVSPGLGRLQHAYAQSPHNK